ncbi:ABC transporter substrate-binding protein [Corynebacterium yudongzhengii]|uniref:ABC transporter substrate-binding protein n=1 Tax=Corynebacterium yudongzhengii TaxID=2080740 RepID=A0A2U1T447_9CORY|nr:ABC transporter substrate-binding protein [Corynebacterium yudongzhengii]PWC00771.1 ABC transporter substrate-binding protein [Corynebacterium yudongzhengii]
MACGGRGAQDTYQLHYTTYSSGDSDQTRTVQAFAEEVEKLSDGAVTFRIHHSGSLLDGDETAMAVTDGRADLGQVASIYATSDLPLFTLSELPFEVHNPEAHMRSLQRLYEENEEYRESFESRGLRMLFPLPLGNAMLGLASAAAAPGELAGRSIRASGLAAEVLLDAGVDPVALGAGEIYESLSRGVVEGYILSIANLPTYGLMDATPQVVDPGMGAWASSIVVINEDLYQSMPTEYQDAIQQAAANTIDFGLNELDSLSDEACSALAETGSEFRAFSPESVSAWRDSAGAAEDWVAENEQKGFDAAGVLAHYREIAAAETAASDYVAPLQRCIEEHS